MSVVGGVLAAIAVLSALRVEHLIASDMWIVFKGSKWKKSVSKLSPAERSDPTVMWPYYEAAGGGAYPWLYFGIRSYRLASVATDRRYGVRRMLAMSVRPLWRYYAFAPAMCVLVSVLTYVPLRLDGLARWSILGIAYLTVLGMIVIAAEGLLSTYHLRSWAVDYHQFPRQKTNPDGSADGEQLPSTLREFVVLAGSAVIELLAVFSLVSVTGVRFGGYGTQFSPKRVPAELESSVHTAFTSLFSGSWSDTVNVVGFFSSLLIFVAFLAYVLILLGVIGVDVSNSLKPSDTK